MVEDFKNTIKANYIQDCLVTIEDIEVAEDIFGPDIHRLKGATTRKKPFQVREDYIEIPPEILEIHQDVTLGIDFFYVNGNAFFLTVSRKKLRKYYILPLYTWMVYFYMKNLKHEGNFSIVYS